MENKRTLEGFRKDARIRISKKTKRVHFDEPLVVTHRFSANAETGLIINQIKRAISECFTYKYFRRVKKVRYSGGPSTLSNGMPYWSFNKTRLGGSSGKSFSVALDTHGLNYLGKTTQVIYLHVSAPSK